MTDNFALLDHDDDLGEHVDRHRLKIAVLLVLLLVVGLAVALAKGWVPTPSFSFASADEKAAKKPGVIERAITKAHHTQVTSDVVQVRTVVVAGLTEPGATVQSVFAAKPPSDVTARIKRLGFDPTESQGRSNRVHLLALRGDDYVVCVDRGGRGPSATYRSRTNKTSTSESECVTVDVWHAP